MENKTQISKDAASNKLTVRRTLDAPLDLVWSAWTTAELLDQWWAPEPWKAVTKSMDFSAGGKWLYAMTGPAGEEHWSMVEYKEIVPQKILPFAGQLLRC